MIEVDPDQVATFVNAMFRHADEGTWISLRAFRDDIDGEPPFGIEALPVNGDLTRIAAAATAMARRCAQAEHPIVFCPPVSTFTNRRKADEASLANGLALSVELDQDAERARKRLSFLIGEPTLVVASGGTWTNGSGQPEAKLHLHWRLREPTRTPEAHARLKRARAMATALVGGDCTNKPMVHPIRMAGSVHRKREPVLCRIIGGNSDAEIDLQDAFSILLDIQPEFRGGGNVSAVDDTYSEGDDRETSELIRALMTTEDYHSTLVALAMRYLKRGMAADHVAQTLRGLMEAIPAERRDGDRAGRWQARYADIWRTVSTARAKLTEQATDQTWPEPLDVLGAPELVGWPELPAECLPEPLYRYVMAEAERLNVDPCPLAGHVLAACSGSISDAWRIKPKLHDHWTQNARIWSCVVKDVGQRGTEMLRAAFWPLKERDRQAFEQWKRERAAWAERQKGRKKGESADDDPEPKPRRVTTSDATIEAASQILSEAGDRHAKLVLIADELTGFLGSFGRYTSNGASARAQWLESYDGGPQQIDRIRRGLVYVSNWSLVAAGNIQPRRLADMGRDLIDDGLFQRFMTSHTKPSPLGADDDLPLAVDAGSGYRELHGQLAQLSPARAADGELAAVYFDDEARAVRKQFVPLIERLQADPTLPTIIRETAPKWSGLLARISLIFHLAQLAERVMAGETLSDRDLCRATGTTVSAAATYLRRVVLPNLFRLGFETMPEQGAPAAHARWIAGHVLAHKLERVIARDIGRAYRPLMGKPIETEQAMAVLCDGGWARKVEGRHDSLRWEINPAVHAHFAQTAASEHERRKQVVKMIRQSVTDL